MKVLYIKIIKSIWNNKNKKYFRNNTEKQEKIKVIITIRNTVTENEGKKSNNIKNNKKQF